MIAALILRLTTSLGLRGMVGIAVITVITAAGGYLYVDLGHQKTLVSVANQKIGAMQIERGQLVAVITAERDANTAQKLAVEQMKSDTESLQTRLAAASTSIATLTKTHASEIQRIRSAVVPKDCAGSVQWLGLEAAGISKKWNENRP